MYTINQTDPYRWLYCISIELNANIYVDYIHTQHQSCLYNKLYITVWNLKNKLTYF